MNYWLNKSKSLKIKEINDRCFVFEKGLYSIFLDMKKRDLKDQFGLCSHCELAMLARMELEFSIKGLEEWFKKSYTYDSNEEANQFANSIKRTILSRKEYEEILKVCHIYRKQRCLSCNK